ncbi:MAG: amidohydrolase [Dehalococcoidia bacterium]|nr:amidohydrolase [Dehalococcoidia bacterium]
MAREYKMISSDSHVNEPPGLWQERVPAKFKDRAPKLQRFPQGDGWVMEGAMDPINFGFNQCASDPPEKTSAWIKWEDCRKGGYDSRERIKEIDLDGVDGELYYPTPRIGNSVFWNNKDREFHLACIRAYNDWLSEYASYAPDRMFGLAMIPTSGPKDAIDELHRAIKLKGIKGIVMGMYPSGDNAIQPGDDAFFKECEDADVPVNIHVALVNEAPGDNSRRIVIGDARFLDAPIRVHQLIFSGVLDRFPKLKVVFAEVDAGWVPYYREMIDFVHARGLKRAGYQPKMMPSAYFDRNLYWEFMVDTMSVKLRHEVGVKNLLWASDHAHSFSRFPNTQKYLQNLLKDVPADEKQLILAGNTMRVYNIGTKQPAMAGAR